MTMRLASSPATLVTEGPTPGTALTSYKHLSNFQVEKFEYLFNAFFDIERNDRLEQNDIESFVEKLRDYAGWHLEGRQHVQLKDVFYECIKDQVKAEYLAEDEADGSDALIPWDEAFKRHSEVDVSGMSLKQWLNMWGRLCYKSAGISDFPIWVQLLPDIFFQAMDKDQDGIASFHEVKNFYRHFVGIEDADDLERIAKEGYRVMTANGDYVLNREHYFFCFANFLLGKSIYGPGKYIFGVFDNRELDEAFKVSYNVHDDSQLKKVTQKFRRFSVFE